MSESGERLQKVMAHAGVASRRVCEDLIAAGRVKVNGTVVRRMGTRVGAEDVIHVDGKRVIAKDSDHLTIAFHKPEGVVTTMDDPEGRPCLRDFVGHLDTRLYHVGRLDIATEGLLLLTNDGDLAHRLAHPSYEVPKTYVATVGGKVSRGTARDLRRGIELEDGPAACDRFTINESLSDMSLVTLTIHMGRNRIVRRMMEAVGHPVLRLVRTEIGPIRLGEMGPGKTRPLNTKELSELMATVGL
ncbi:MAG: pseudouridine synthase [Bowdeniella nasicola]|nr:pseudouridine synthase [Bowdeniella nasicola]